jgi:hypothetical protein
VVVVTALDDQVTARQSTVGWFAGMSAQTEPQETRDDTPTFRYTAALAQDSELRWQDWWDEHGTFETPNPAGSLSDPELAAERGEKLFLDRAWSAVLDAMSPQLAAVGPVVSGGRSAGARVACRTAAATGVAAVVALAFPLHPPGRPERSRLAELEDCPVPTLVVQGDRDAFGGPADFPRGRAYAVYTVPGGDHSFRVPRGHDFAGALQAMTASVAGWLLDQLP